MVEKPGAHYNNYPISTQHLHLPTLPCILERIAAFIWLILIFRGLKAADSGYIMVTRSVNGGITWKTPVKAISYKAQPNLPIDRPWIAADASNGPYSGRVYLTSQNAYFTPQPHYPWITYSSDSGATWSPIKRLDDSIPSGTITDATAFTTVSANGTLYAAYVSYYTKYSLYPRLVVIKSSNGGNTFTPYTAITYGLSDAMPAADSLTKAGSRALLRT